MADYQNPPPPPSRAHSALQLMEKNTENAKQERNEAHNTGRRLNDETNLDTATTITVCQVVYTVQFSTMSSGYNDAQRGYEDVVQQLAAAVESGAFDSFLHDYAALYQVPQLQAASSPPGGSKQSLATSFTFSSVGNTVSSGDKNINSLATIATIVVLVAVVLVIAVVCFMCRQQTQQLLLRQGGKSTGKAGSKYAELSLDTDSMHDSPLSDHSSGARTGAHSPGTARNTNTTTSLSRLAASSVVQGLRSYGASGARPAQKFSKGRGAGSSGGGEGSDGDCTVDEMVEIELGQTMFKKELTLRVVAVLTVDLSQNLTCKFKFRQN